MKTKTTLSSLYSFPGFRASNQLKGILGDPHARIITLSRRQKKRFVPHAEQLGPVVTTPRSTACGTNHRPEPAFILNSNTGDSIVAVVGP